jgi:hypothetical protein
MEMLWRRRRKAPVKSDAEIIRERVQKAFTADVSDDFVLQFLAELRTNMRDAENGTRRATRLIAFLAISFELVNRGAVAEASLFFIKISSLDFVLIGIPVVIAYMCYESCAFAVESNNLYWVHRKLIEVRYPTVSAQSVDLFAIPVADPFGQAMRDVRYRRRNSFLKVAAWLRFPLLIMVPPLAAGAFEIYAFVQLLRRHDMNHALVTAVALTTCGLLTLAAARIATEAPHGGGPWRGR